MRAVLEGEGDLSRVRLDGTLKDKEASKDELLLHLLTRGRGVKAGVGRPEVAIGKGNHALTLQGEALKRLSVGKGDSGHWEV